MRHALRIFVLTLATGLALAVLAHAGPLEEVARNTGRPLIVRFGLERCLQCIQQGQAFDALEPKYAGEMTFRFVHIGQEEEMAGEYKVLLIPTVLFFDTAGNEVFRNVGYLAPDALEAEFHKAGFPGVTPGG